MANMFDALTPEVISAMEEIEMVNFLTRPSHPKDLAIQILSEALYTQVGNKEAYSYSTGFAALKMSSQRSYIPIEERK